MFKQISNGQIIFHQSMINVIRIQQLKCPVSFHNAAVITHHSDLIETVKPRINKAWLALKSHHAAYVIPIESSPLRVDHLDCLHWELHGQLTLQLGLRRKSEYKEAQSGGNQRSVHRWNRLCVRLRTKGSFD